MTRIGVSAGFSSGSSLPPPAARRSCRKLWTCPYRPGGLRHRAALLRSSLPPPPPAGSRYYCIQQHKSDRTNSGRQRRRGVQAAGGGQLMKRPLTGRNHHIHILLAVSQSKMTWSFHKPSHRKKMKSIILMMNFCGICTYLVYIEQAERREYTTVQSIVV